MGGKEGIVYNSVVASESGDVWRARPSVRCAYSDVFEAGEQRGSSPETKYDEERNDEGDERSNLSIVKEGRISGKCVDWRRDVWRRRDNYEGDV